MTIHIGAREYLIVCDRKGCYEEDVHHTYTKYDAEKVFKEKGWTVGKECLCPMHSPSKRKKE